MEDILASIKKVIAEEKELRGSGQVTVPAPHVVPDESDEEFDGDVPADATDSAAEEVLELDEVMVEELVLPPVDLGPPLVSEDAAAATRARLETLAATAAAAPPPPAINPLEQVVRDMLRPVLKEWLDQHLPAIVDEHVKREVARITGQPL
ncbi:pole-organizing protein PopZ [Sphingomonas swuensis]|uniref:Pole-organizing protein PopZ n=2 Tax=Sphingomonas swuensis TaxID=977800 RepID=A0ABP7SP04_9SPHN